MYYIFIFDNTKTRLTNEDEENGSYFYNLSVKQHKVEKHLQWMHQASTGAILYKWFGETKRLAISPSECQVQ